MTNGQFDALRDWIKDRTDLLIDIRERPNDTDFCRARYREIKEADELARLYLVDETPETAPSPDDI